MLDWLEQCRRVYNYALRQRKDWINSRKCRVDACSLRQEYIMSADQPIPDYIQTTKTPLTKAKKQIPEFQAVHSQVLQDALKRLEPSILDETRKAVWVSALQKKSRDAYRSFCIPSVQIQPCLLVGK